MSGIIGPDLASKFFGTRINASRSDDVPVDEETINRLAEIYADDYRMLEQIG